MYCFDSDINECEGGEGWEGDPVTCEEGTFCENTRGGHQCKACHVACLGGCKGAGPTNCIQCKDGFNMDDGECKGQILTCASTKGSIIVVWRKGPFSPSLAPRGKLTHVPLEFFEPRPLYRY